MAPIGRREFLGTAASVALPAAAQQTGRVVVVGDVHGDLDRLVDVLSMAGLVGDRQEWTGGTAQLVQLGDLVDRGPRSREVIEYLQKLEKEARKAQGRVWRLIGNHEAMRMFGDLRDVPAQEYGLYANRKSQAAREKLYQLHIAQMEASGDPRKRLDLSLGYRQQWEKEHPLGEMELLQAFSAQGVYGKWLVEQRAALRLADTLFVHAGISPKYAEWSESRLNSRVKEELTAGGRQGEDAVCRDLEGPLWWRGFAQDSEASLEAHVGQLLSRHGVKRIIVGHVPTGGRGVVSRLGGKLVLADVGLSSQYGGRRACVVIEGGVAAALDQGKRLQLK
ncbi:MAG: metallophosphoesterase [Candidatus Solibacter usitatus]|nr:metallophosphoesterase [Candidatus Solibacter usitatus]